VTRNALLCPGRGSYTERSLGSLRASLPFVQRAEELRARYGLPSLVELDRVERFSPSRHLDPVNASALIWLVSMIDAEQAKSEHEIVLVGGNSMGWYTALAVAGALSFDDAFRLVQGLAILQAQAARETGGGQVLYPLVDAEWRLDPERVAAVEAALASAGAPVYRSIHLGGFAVLAGAEDGLAKLQEALPTVELGRGRYPFRLAQHGPYHTPLCAGVSAAARSELPALHWRPPEIPLVDGRGRVHAPWSCDPGELRDYTLGAQIVAPYDFTASVRVTLREWAPERLILPGPGNPLGSIVGQVLVAERWRGIDSKSAFTRVQESANPIVTSMRA